VSWNDPPRQVPRSRSSGSAGLPSRSSPAADSIRYWAALTVAAGYPAGVPHSPQNFAPVRVVPQFPQHFFADSAAASAPPQCWQNFPPPLSCPTARSGDTG